MRGIDLADMVADPGVSAGKALCSREGGQKILEAVRRGQVDAVIAYKLDRLFRDASDCLSVTKGWDKANVGLHLVDMGGQSIDTTTAMGRFFLTVMAGAAEMERNLVRERTSMAMQCKRAKGEYTGGHVPYGWRLNGDGVTLIPNREEQKIIEAARKLRTAGLSLRKIADELEADGLLPRSGGRWHAKTVKDLLRAKAA